MSNHVLNVGLVGGGGAFIVHPHQKAIHFDGTRRVTCGALHEDPAKALEFAKDWACPIKGYTSYIRFGIAGIALFLTVISLTAADNANQPEGATPELLQELKAYPYKIVYESYRGGNWDIWQCSADGSNPVNLTKTPDSNELYPKVSPDGKQVCFVEEGPVSNRTRNVYLMNIDGSDRRKIADDAREPCWSPDGKSIAFTKNEYKRFDIQDPATKGIFYYDLETGQTREHSNKNILHVWCLDWTPDGNWFIASVHGGMGYIHNIIAIELAGNKTFDLKCLGCRPDISPDGKKIIWGNDLVVGMADLDLSGTPKASGHRWVLQCKEPNMFYHVDWSPDGRYIVFTYGPKLEGKPRRGLSAGWAPAIPGVEAPGWNICVADAAKPNRWVAITLDGASCKEPDWVPGQ